MLTSLMEGLAIRPFGEFELVGVVKGIQDFWVTKMRSYAFTEQRQLHQDMRITDGRISHETIPNSDWLFNPRLRGRRRNEGFSPR